MRPGRGSLVGELRRCRVRPKQKKKKEKEIKRKQVTYIASFILLPDSTVIEALQQMCPFCKDEAKRVGESRHFSSVMVKR